MRNEKWSGNTLDGLSLAPMEDKLLKGGASPVTYQEDRRRRPDRRLARDRREMIRFEADRRSDSERRAAKDPWGAAG